MTTGTVTIAGTVPQWTTRDRLRKAREITGQSQAEFAKDLGVSRGTVKNYESGAISAYRRPTLLAWAMRSGVPLEWLLTGQESPSSSPSPSKSLESTTPAGSETTRWYADNVVQLFSAIRVQPYDVAALKSA